jgi:acyl carrier protein
MDQRTLVRDFVVQNFLFGDAAGLASDTVSLLESGIMDSLGVMELINFLESDLKIKVPDTDLIPQNLDSIDNLVAYIERRRGSQA